MNKIKSIMVWCVSIYSILAGICTDEFTISNILFILAGLCIMPPVVKKITEKTSKYSQKVKWIIFIALALFAYGTYPTSNIEVNNSVVPEQNMVENYTVNNETKEVDSSAEEQAQIDAEEQAKKEAEEEAQRLAEEQAKKEAEEAQRQAEEQAKKEAEEESKRLAEEQAKKEAEEEAKRQAEEQAKKEAEEKARKEAEEQTKQKSESQTKKQTTKVTVPASETGSNLVWVPTNGGTKYHRRSGCSNMKNPNQVSKETAEANGFTPCGRCY